MNMKTMLHKYICGAAMAGAVLIGSSAGALAASPEAVIKTVTSTIAIEKEAHERGSKWEREQAALQEEIRQAKLEEAWYALQVDTFTRYVSTAQGRVDALTTTRDELERMEAELEGELVASVTALETFVQSDVPFLPQERADRLKFLHTTVDNYDVTGAEKMRRILEAMQVELAYGNSIEVTQSTIAAEAGNQNVQLVRIGRVGLFALSPDGKKSWSWNAATGFTPMDSVYTRSLQHIVAGNVQTLPALPFSEVR